MVCGVSRSKNPCVRSNVPVSNVHMCLNMWACCRYTRRRVERSHGGVLNLHTVLVFIKGNTCSVITWWYGILSSELRMPAHGSCVGKTGGPVATDDGDPPTSRTGVCAIENSSQTRSDATGGRLRLGRSYPKSWSGNTPLGGFSHARSPHGLGHVDLKHEAEKLTQRITKGTLGATEAWDRWSPRRKR